MGIAGPARPSPIRRPFHPAAPGRSGDRGWEQRGQTQGAPEGPSSLFGARGAVTLESFLILGGGAWHPPPGLPAPHWVPYLLFPECPL